MNYSRANPLAHQVIEVLQVTGVLKIDKLPTFKECVRDLGL
jgi:hypothetical protein